VGSILKISGIYQTPAIGFEGDDFLNCVLLVQSALVPTKVLDTILGIEKKLGRERTQSGVYASRPIDIDILFVDDLIKVTKTLTIPHPEIQNRKFVLQPLIEINSDLIHPKFGKNIVKLLAKSKDKSTLVKQSKWLRNPGKDYDLSKFNYIAIEGNIPTSTITVIESGMVSSTGATVGSLILDTLGNPATKILLTPLKPYLVCRAYQPYAEDLTTLTGSWNTFAGKFLVRMSKIR